MKKILLLGGAAAQVPSIKKAKELGYYTITCDYLPDNPGHKFADEYHNVSTTDKEAVLKLAQELEVNGVVCYASDPAAETAAYVSEKMGLAGHPYKSVEILANKDLFRKFLAENGFNTPKANGYVKAEDIKNDWHLFKKPIMIKPVDSSGSKGITKIERLEDIDKAFEYALSFTRAKRIVVEEYIEAYGGQILGEGFSVDGKLVFAEYANHHFDKDAINPYTPSGGSWPSKMPRRVLDNINSEIQKVFSLLNMKSGAYNFEARIDKDENVYLMEIGPRNGGNMIPQVIQHATGFDMVEYTIKAAMGENCSGCDKFRLNGCFSYYVLHSNKAGIFNSLDIDSEFAKKNLVELNLMKKQGDEVLKFSGAGCSLGVMILKFENEAEMHTKMNNMSEYVKVVLK